MASPSPRRTHRARLASLAALVTLAATTGGLVAAAGTGPVTGRRAGARARPLRWIAIGGGAFPEENQISLEQDLGLAREVFGPADGRVYFAGGPGAHGVQVVEGNRRPSLRRRLGDLFAPRGGRDATYRRVSLPADGAASPESFRTVLQQALVAEGPPLTVFLATHGEAGEHPAETTVRLWGGHPLTPASLAAWLESWHPRRPLQLVVAACHAGGFNELAFAGADEDAGPTPQDRCVLAATTWERLSSGCDPNPDRAAHEGFSLHFLEALRGRDARGRPLPPSEIDFDGDGRISLLEAHARARIAGASLDVPSTSSERWLRAVAPQTGPRAPVELPIETAVLQRLKARLGLNVRQARAHLDALQSRLDRLAARRDAHLDSLDAAYYDLTGALLARWPVLDDPWHPDFEATLRRDGETIERFLDTDPRALRYQAELRAVERLEDAMDAIDVRMAPLLRLLRTHENLLLAGRLKAQDPAGWRRFLAFRACESAPFPARPAR